MTWLIAACAIAALIAASFVAIGRLGGMPEPINDTYRPTLPADRSATLPARVPFGKVLRGYDPAAVDAFLQACAGGDSPTAAQIESQRFSMATPGYAPDQVDDALDRLAEQARHRATVLAPATDWSMAGSGEPAHADWSLGGPARPASSGEQAPAEWSPQAGVQPSDTGLTSYADRPGGNDPGELPVGRE